MSVSVTAVVVVAILASAWVRVVRIYYGSDRAGRRGGAAARLADAAGPSPHELELEREVQSLRERIHVLERIATDGRKTDSLAAEIESLRGK